MSGQAAVQTQTTAKLVVTPIASGVFQRQCACGRHTSAGSECEECKKQHEGVLQRATIGLAPVHDVPPIVHEVLRSPGQPLDARTRAFMEPRFGHDFSGVRVHTDARATESARAVNALAYTWQKHVVLQDRAQFMRGSRLLAHELAHVVQQEAVISGMPHAIAPAGDCREQAADLASSRIATGNTAQVVPMSPAVLSLTRDTRLERFLEPLSAIAREVAALSPEEQVERIMRHFAGVNLRDPDNYTSVSDAVAKFFPEQSLFLFLQLVEQDASTARIAQEEQSMQDTLRRLSTIPRRGVYGTVTPFPVTEIITGSAARAARALTEATIAFFEGVIEGMGGTGSDQLIADLQGRLTQSAILNAVAPVVFATGAVVGIGQDLWQSIRGLWDVIIDFSGMIDKFRQLFSTILSPAGPALSRRMGHHTGQEWRVQLVQMAGYNVFRFTYELGRLIGPTIVYAVLTVLGITAEAVVASIAGRFAGIFRQFPAVMRLIERIGEHLPRRRRSPIAGATDAEIDAVIEALEGPSVTGPRSRPRIEGHAVPTRQRGRLDLQDIPCRTGETMRAALARVRQIIGRKVSDVAAIRAAWERARQHVLQTRTLDATNYEELYNLTRNRFWQEVRGDSAAMQHFTDAGFHFPQGNTTAPVLRGVSSDIPVTETRVSLDHIAEKAIGQNWRLALDGDNLEMTFAMPNTYREIIQSRHPELR